VTGFNPKYQNVEANELTATYTVDFSGKKSCMMLLLNQRITWPIKRNGQFQNTINIY
jgi:hypothetical protein